MKIEDFLEKPTIYAVKKDGILLTDFIISQNDLMLMEFYLLEKHKVIIPCDSLECNCVQDAWGKTRRRRGNRASDHRRDPRGMRRHNRER